jgi:hypothetical protein
MAGRYEITLSPQGQLKLRENFSMHNDRVFLTNHIVPGASGQRCLAGHSAEDWGRVVEEFGSLRGREVQIFTAF